MNALMIGSLSQHQIASRSGAVESRVNKYVAKKAAQSHHASIRAERRRKRKAKQTRKVTPGNNAHDPRQANVVSLMNSLAALLVAKNAPSIKKAAGKTP